jgi:hypothetical protein
MTDASTETLPIAEADAHAKAPFFPVSVTKLVVLRRLLDSAGRPLNFTVRWPTAGPCQ